MSAPVEQKKKKKESKRAALLDSDWLIVPDVETKQAPKPSNVSGAKRPLSDRVDALETQVDDLVKVVNQHADATTLMKQLLTKTSEFAAKKISDHDKCILDWARVGKRQQKEISDQRTAINEIAATVKSIKERLDADAHKKKMEERHKRASNEQAPSDRARILNGEDSD